MINLLPTTERKQLEKEYQLRFGVLAAVALLLLEIMSVGLFFPSYYTIIAATKSKTQDLAAIKAGLPKGSDDPQAALATMKAELAILKPPGGANAVLPSAILNTIISKKTSGILLSGFDYQVNSGAGFVTLRGFSATREELLDFQKILKADPNFSAVEFPQTVFSGKTNLNFNIRLTLK